MPEHVRVRLEGQLGPLARAFDHSSKAALHSPIPSSKRLAELDGTVLGGSPADFGKLIAEETEKWGKVVKFANINPD